MHALIRWSAIVVAIVAGVVVLAAGGVYIASERRLNERYDVTPASITIPSDAAAVDRGAHLARAVTTCTLCHGEDGGGGVYADMGMVGLVAGPNLTRGRGGLGDELSDQDWVRAIRHGVRRDGTSLIVMPSEVYAHLSDEDLGAIIAFFKQLPSVDREVPASHFGPIGRLLLVTGRLDVLVAPKTPADAANPYVPAAATPEYGRYLADIGGCHGCHGFGLSGGRVAGPPDLPPASNLTVTGIGNWTETDFFRAMRQGTRPDGSRLDTFMPWPSYSRMTNEELQALWLYLRSVPPKEFGNK